MPCSPVGRILAGQGPSWAGRQAGRLAWGTIARRFGSARPAGSAGKGREKEMKRWIKRNLKKRSEIFKLESDIIESCREHA